MSYTINTHILEKLRDEFAQNQLPLDIQPDQMVAHGSKENVCQVVAKAGFCPIFLEQGEKIPFTIVPYQSPLPIISKDRLLALLAQRKYCSRGWVEDPEISWLSVNASRTFVHKALSACISKVVSKNVRGDYPAIEIGAGMGYFLAGRAASATVRTQPNEHECLLLNQTTGDTVFVATVQDLRESLCGEGKRIPLFFANDVFDTMSSEQRKTCFSQIAELQSHGDRLVIMLDTNPALWATFRQLAVQYPNYAAVPILSATPAKLSTILIPLELMGGKQPPIERVVQTIDEDALALARTGKLSEGQLFLHRLKRDYGLKEIAMEDFYKGLVKEELAEAGYTSTDYYTASFEPGIVPKNIPQIQQNVFYKPVTDSVTVRQWSPTDSRFVKLLSSKGIFAPHFDEKYLAEIRGKGQIMQGAEVLVIEALKI